ncbi:MAG TPA: hypothetical protein VE643_07465 [Nitrososphaeraceae archaeon]|nr:hypothetical protein [Nitrososphaeraceae archaeon]
MSQIRLLEKYTKSRLDRSEDDDEPVQRNELKRIKKSSTRYRRRNGIMQRNSRAKCKD